MKIVVPLDGVTSPSRSFKKSSGDEITVHALPVLPASPFVPNWRGEDSPPTFNYDASTLIAAFDRPFPLDVDHASEGDALDTRARGWCYALCTSETEPELPLTPGVLYGLFELNRLGAEALADRHYGYTSAVVDIVPDTTELSRVRANTLTNSPATDMPIAFSALKVSAAYTSHQQLSDENDAMLEKLIEILGLTPEATEDEAIAAVAALVAAAAEAKEAADKAAEAAPAAEAPSAAAGVSQEAFSALSAQVAELAGALKRNTAAFSAFAGTRITPTPSTSAAPAAGTPKSARAREMLASMGLAD